MNAVMISTPNKDLGLVPADKAKAEAQQVANEEGQPLTMRDPVTDKVVGRFKPAKKAAQGKGANAKPTKAAKSQKPTTARPKPTKVAPDKAKPDKPKAPKGVVVEILKLASRAKGVTPAELNELTKWKGAPWKWLFSNPKGTGYCDRWGYKFKVVADDDGTHYQVVKK